MEVMREKRIDMAITVEKAAALAAELAPQLGQETLELARCRGRVLAEDLVAPGPWPPFARSPLDGYALRAADSAPAREGRPVRLEIQGTLYAGMAAQVPLLQGRAFRIMTGAMLPPGADCVLRQEETKTDGNFVIFSRSLAAGENFIPAGEDFEGGALLLQAGCRLDAAALSLAAAAGRAKLPLRKRCRVALISTGDELLPPGQALCPGKIYDSNSVYLSARLEELGAEPCLLARGEDRIEPLCRTLQQGAAAGDLLITSGGVSVGERDLLPAALKKLGAEICFQGVAMKPGMPTLLARLGDKPVLALSGNPFAAAVGLELLGRPLLGCPMERGKGRLQAAFEKKSPSRRFVRGHCREGALRLPRAQGNGQMRALLGCNCLAEIPPGSGALPAGTELDLWYL